MTNIEISGEKEIIHQLQESFDKQVDNILQ